MRYTLPHEVFRKDPWRSRGYLPHFDQAGTIQHITFRLADSLPRSVLTAWQAELASLPESERRRAKDERIEKWLDQGSGECLLRDDKVAAIVEGAILHFDDVRYRLFAWCIMPNHVHAVVETIRGHPLDRILHSWKSFSSSRANRVLGRTGRLWQTEYYDRFIRDERHLNRVLEYVEHNPVAAGLVAEAEGWRWGSASRRRAARGG